MMRTVSSSRISLLALALALSPWALACDGDSADAPDTVTAGDTVAASDAVIAEDTGAASDTAAVGERAAWPGWGDATVYFVITDRFFDGDPSNNNSYGRQADGDGEYATFHGGDLVGLTAKLEAGYFRDLGVSAIWITAPYEQTHGWITAGPKRHYAYHGYYALDFTKVDANMGTEAELGAFIGAAHAQGIRVIFDVVMNHPGYATPADLAAYGVDVLEEGWEDATPSTLYTGGPSGEGFIRFDDPNFDSWWGPEWIRAEIGASYPPPGDPPLLNNVDYLPDFITESTEAVTGLPPFYAHKADTLAVERPGYTVRDYLVEWLTRWVEDYGVDGFRCDTVKHVEPAAWAELKEAADGALVRWRQAHPEERFPDGDYADTAHPFWMTGEVWDHGVSKDDYYANGFDSLINFSYAAAAAAALDDPAQIDATWVEYDQKINSDPGFNALSYLSSHDTSLFFERSARRDEAKQMRAAALLLFSPGAVQIFYGDENGRTYAGVQDATHRRRTDYVWGDKPELLAHWQKLGRFRARHPAIGAGAHTKLSESPYIFKREEGDDVVYIALHSARSVTVDVSADFAEGAALRDYYTGETQIVSGGSVTFQGAAEGVTLIERAE